MQISGQRQIGLNMHSASQRVIQQQQRNARVLTSDINLTNSTSNLVSSSPGPLRRRFSSGSGRSSTSEPSSTIGSPMSTRSRIDSGLEGNKDVLNYAFGTGSMVQTHLNEEPFSVRARTGAKASPSTSISGYDGVFTGLTRRNSLGVMERKDSLTSLEKKQMRHASVGSSTSITNSGFGATMDGQTASRSRKEHHTIMRSSAQVDAALALEDLRRREKFARHVDNIWTKDVVDSLGKILRKKRSKKRLPVALTQLEATREGEQAQ